jgi:hypothetical protein
VSRVVLQSKRAGETRVYTFDPISQLQAGQTVSSAVVTSAVYSGVDANPASMISGSATVALSRVVSQKLTGGVAGVLYTITCTFTLSDSTIIVMSGILAVLPATL